MAFLFSLKLDTSLKIHFGTPDSVVFPSHKNKIFLQIHINILFFHTGKRTVIDLQLTGRNGKWRVRCAD